MQNDGRLLFNIGTAGQLRLARDGPVLDLAQAGGSVVGASVPE